MKAADRVAAGALMWLLAGSVSLRACLSILLVMSLGVAGCSTLATPDDTASAVDVPAGWSSTDAAGGVVVTATRLTDWWQRFDDAELNAWEQLALQGSPRVLAAQAALRQAQAQRDVARAALSPTLDANASAQRSSAAAGSSFATTDTTGTTTAGSGVDGTDTRSTINRFRTGLDANWAPDLFGVRRAALQAADASVQARTASLGDVQVQVTAEVALAYIDLRSAQACWSLARSNLASQQETLQITDWRLQAGLVSTLELQQARAAVAQTQALLPALQTAIAQSRHALAVLSGAPPAFGLSREESVNADESSRAVPVAAEGLALDIPAQTLRQRADVRAAEFEVAAALARVGQAQAQRWPSFALGGTLGLSALTLGALDRSASVVGSLLASVSLPLFDGGGLRAQVRLQQAALDQARQTHRAAVLAALQDVEDALVALQGERLHLADLRIAADASREAAELARQRYAGGLIDFQTVLQTQRTQLTAEDAVATASADLGRDHVRLFKALGGGWREGDVGFSTPTATSSNTLDRTRGHATP